MNKSKSKIIFFGNGPLADSALRILNQTSEIIFHAHDRADLEKAVELKTQHPDAHGVLASFGVLIPGKVLAAFEPEGILNIHPSLLPKYRGASPIESAIIAGDTAFGVSVMKLVKAMDAGPIYYQTEFKNLPLEKPAIYDALATAGAKWLVENLENLPTPTPQAEKNATFTRKFEKTDGIIDPTTESADEILRKIIAFQGFPKVKFPFYGKNCILLAAHPLDPGTTAPLTLNCAHGSILAIDRLQPEGKRPMDAQSFKNGYAK